MHGWYASCFPTESPIGLGLAPIQVDLGSYACMHADYCRQHADCVGTCTIVLQITSTHALCAQGLPEQQLQPLREAVIGLTTLFALD